MRFWLLFVLLFPLLAVQAVITRRTALRLPDALGPREGHAGNGTALTLLVAGESTTAGVGVRETAAALPAQLAEALAETTGIAVHWKADGVTGCQLADVQARLKHQNRKVDLVVIATGVNDTTALTPLKRWRTLLNDTAMLASQQGAQVAVLALPPMAHFTALPQPLRYVIGLRAAMLDRAAQETATATGRYRYIDWQVPLSSVYLAEDGYHPSAAGYRRMARDCAGKLADLIAH
jgi:lysophospholipase L1-like esterase